MKLKHFLKPTDSYFSTPKAARKLLRLFAKVLVSGLIGVAVLSLGSILSSEMSVRQGYMSDAIADARVFFTQREALLRSLDLLAVRDDSHAVPGQDPLWNTGLRLHIGPETSSWALWLPRRMVNHLKQSKVNFLYVAENQNTEAVRLVEAVPFDAPVPPGILQRLRNQDPRNLGPEGNIWISDQESSKPRLYIFTGLGSRDSRSGWIGLEMDASDVASTLHDDTAGTFVMLNPSGELMMSSASHMRFPQPLLSLDRGREFGFVGAGVVPEQLVMRKQLGYSDWQLFYAIDLHTLLDDLWWPLFIAVVFLGLSTAGVCLLVLRIERRLITPATHRIDALIESEAFSRAVIQTAPVALCVLRRADGKVVLENALSQQWLGECNERERLCHGWIEQAFDEGDSDQSDEFQTTDGRHLYLSFVRTRYSGEDVLFCAFSDISSRKQVEAAMALAKQLADAANEAKTLFLATMSHEIRTPLYGVLGTLELLGRTDLKSQQKAYLQAIESSSAALLNLVCDVLDVAKIEAGQLALEVSEFSPIELVHDVVQSYAGAARKKGLHLYSYIDPKLPARLRGDLTRIRQILNNLLNNAVKFTESGQIVLRVKVVSRDDERVEVVWQVADSGPGIRPADQKLLFEPFYQSVGNTNVIAGTGLGLSICQRLAALMNGSIRVVSAPGLGSSFILSVPLEKAQASVGFPATARLLSETVFVHSPSHEMADYVASWLRSWGAKPKTDLTGHCALNAGGLLIEVYPHERREMPFNWNGPRIIISAEEADETPPPNHWHVSPNNLKGMFEAVSHAQGILQSSELRNASDTRRQLNLHVLVAEDNVINQLILKDQLEELGCSVELASDGQEALLRWQGGRFDVVLSDINMPRMNGYELARELRRQGCDVAIVGATANAMRDESDRCLAAGMQQLLVKPFGLNALFNCLQTYVRKSPCAL